MVALCFIEKDGGNGEDELVVLIECGIGMDCEAFSVLQLVVT